MIEINLSNINNVITINLESNTVVAGSYVNANYSTVEEYKTLEIDNFVNSIINSDINTKLGTNYITNTKTISTYDDIIEHFKPATNKYFVTGTTDSKFTLITKYYRKENMAITDPVIQKNKMRNFAGNGSGETVEIFETYEDNNLIRSKKQLLLQGLNIYAMILSENSSGQNEYILYLNTENPIKYIDIGDNLSIFTYMRSHDEPAVTANIILYDTYIDEPKIISEVFIDRGVNSAFEKIKKLKNIKNINELTKTGLGYYKINTKGYNFKNI